MSDTEENRTPGSEGSNHDATVYTTEDASESWTDGSRTVGSTEESSSYESEKPKDRFHLVYLAMMLNGIGVLIPWSCFITIAPEYFVCLKLRAATSTGAVETVYSRNFLKYLASASQGPNLLLNLFNVFFTISGSLVARIFVCIIIMLVISGLTMVFVFVNTSTWVGPFFWLTMALVVILNGAGGLYMNSLFGIAADLPPSMTASIIVGTNLAGVLCALVAIASRATATSSVSSATAYFSVSLVLVAACGLSLVFLRSSKFYQYHVNKAKAEKPESIKGTIDSVKESIRQVPGKMATYKLVCKKAWIQLFNIWLCLFVTTGIYPTIQAEVRPRDDFLIPKEYFELVTTFFSFAFFAMIGAMLTNFIQWPSPNYLTIPVVLRLAFLPFFLACNYRPNTRHWPVLIENEWAFIVAGAVMALSSGYLSTLGLMYAPRVVPPSASQSAGMMGSLIFVLGLNSGILFSYLEVYIMENVGPLTPLQVGDATGDMCAALAKAG